MEPREGLLTFRAEGNNISNSIYYSRKIHWPGNLFECQKFGSGVTIGRGYDLKYRSSSEVIHDLTRAGVPVSQAKKIAEAARIDHCRAGDFVKNKKEEIGEITEIQQLTLFENIYQKYVNDAIIFYNNYKNLDSVTWGSLNPTLKDVLVDMKYQGRLKMDRVPIFGKNEKSGIIKLIKSNPWLSGDERARRRIAYIESYMK